MNTSIKLSSFIVGLLISFTPAISHAEQTVYGWELMSEQERIQHRETMRSFQTEQEREAYRHEHHQRMVKRARERGIELPDAPRPMGGPGEGMGMGGGRKP